MGDVVSILGHRYAPPRYADRRGRRVQFLALMEDGSRVAASGHLAPFGLVIHRTVVAGPDARVPYNRWGISEPRTGARVAAGWTRQAALDALAGRVAHHGGESAFEAVLQACVENLLDGAAPQLAEVR